MSDSIKHECGIALLRLRKPLEYYYEKYDYRYGAECIFNLMNKQRNRGQDGAGIVNIKIDVPPGYRYISRYREIGKYGLETIIKKVNQSYKKIGEKIKDNSDTLTSDILKQHFAFTGELWLGHLRYGTSGKNQKENCHPFLRQNNWRTKTLVLAGNFNMTNVDELFAKLISLGQFPKEKVDTVTVLEKIGHFLDNENQQIFEEYKDLLTNNEITKKIEENLDLINVLKNSCKDFDGGYTMAGVTGYGAAFVARDPAGIRPAYYYANDEVVIVTSERVPIQVTTQCEYDEIKEITPGCALIVNQDGSFYEERFKTQTEKRSCSFERIYFSRGTDPSIYRERLKLGDFLMPEVLNAINLDISNTVFSFIPNTAEVSFMGLIQNIESYLVNQRKEIIIDGKPSPNSVEHLLEIKPRVEKLLVKDAKMRTFITEDEQRSKLVASAYDVTHGIIRKGQDTIVIMDDSIVRGTTLEKSILNLLCKLSPKKIVVVSSAPQIRYPDCYGIDMSIMKEFVAFRAMISLIKENGLQSLLEEVKQACEASIKEVNPINYVKRLYDTFSTHQITEKIAEIVTPKDSKIPIQVVFQNIENLHKACPDHLGDWYFTGNYPTPGGVKIVNKAFINYMNDNSQRAGDIF